MRAGSVIGERFELVEIAGSGGMGTVWRARDRRSGEAVALKVLADLVSAERFMREAELLAELVHPRIVRYVAHGHTEKDGPLGPGRAAWIAMEWLEGEDLGARLLRQPLTIGETLKLAAAVASALGAAHARGIVHRDVKPSNVMLCGGSPSDVKVLDFGIARRLRTVRVTRTGVAIGTPAYMAPEQARGGREIDARADVFSLGCVLFECLTGKQAFVAEHELALLAKVLLEEPPRLGAFVQGLPPGLEDLVTRMLAKDAADRPADGRAVAEALSALGPLDDVSAATAPALATTPAAPAALTGGERHVSTVLLVVSATADEEPPSGIAGHEPTVIAPPPLVDVAARFAGRVEALADGAVVATFEHVRTPTDQAAAAARCALALRGAAKRARMALATGRSDTRAARPLGRAIDRAAHLLASAARARAATKEEDILVDEVTAALLEGGFDVASTSTIDGVFLLRGERTEEVERTLLGRPTPLVGRDRELHTLEAILDESAGERVARAVLVIGNAGVGKSRLRQELVRRVRRRDPPVTVWSARAEPLGGPSPFGLVAPMLRAAAGIREGDGVEARRERLSRWLSRRFAGDDLARITGALADLVGIGLLERGGPSGNDDGPLGRGREELRERERLDPVVAGDRLRRAWEDVLAACCSEGPLLLVLEDLHWGDASSVTCIDQALRNLAHQPLMVLALARPEVTDRFPRLWESRHVEVMRLGGLTPRASARLVRAVLGETVPDGVVDRIVARADGNAFFLEELIRAAATGREDGTLPDTVLGMVEARLLELDPEARRVLRAASVLGQTFWPGAVHALLGDRERRGIVDDWLDVLTHVELVTRTPGPARFGGEIELAFRHALVREAAYAMLTSTDRVVGHRLAGSWLEARGETDAMALAQHFDLGEEPGRAVIWYRRAAEQALEGHDFAGAIARAERALACGADRAMRAELMGLMAVAYKWNGANAEASRCAAEALALAEPGSDVWAAAAGEATIADGDLGNRDRIDELATLILPLWRARRTPLLAIAMARVATQLDYVGEVQRATLLLDEIAAATDVASDPIVRANLDLAMSMHHLCAGSAFESMLAMRRASESLAIVGDDRRRYLALSNLGYLQGELGQLEEAERHLRAAIEGCAKMGLDSVGAGALSNLGNLLLRIGQIDEAERMEREAIATFVSQGHPRMEGASRIYLARILVERGRLEEAETEAERARDLLDGTPLHAYAVATLAHVRSRLGRIEEALADARAAWEALEALGVIDDGEAFVRLVYAEALSAAGREEPARTAIQAARAALLRRMATIPDPDVRRSFAERVPDHARTFAFARDWLREDAVALAAERE